MELSLEMFRLLRQSLLLQARRSMGIDKPKASMTKATHGICGGLVEKKGAGLGDLGLGS
jgi:hypothetical protein